MVHNGAFSVPRSEDRHASSARCAARCCASHQTIASLAPRSATTPIAMAVASEIGGIPSLTAVLVISTVYSAP
ncbi:MULTISPECIES: LrgB family protein [Paraburkholderia]|uniref:LrgB family protein n=1 Tax=Paraburkholderia dipogonis TaxID=1211383 RepID=A0ABW9B286_9BURK